MPTRTPSPPRGASRKFIIIFGGVVVAMIAIMLFGFNAQHAKDMQDKNAGIVKPQDAPMSEKDLGKSPVRK